MLSVREVADRVGLSEWAVRRAIADGELEAFKLRGRIRITGAAVQGWLDASRVQPVRRPPVPPAPFVVGDSRPTNGDGDLRPWNRRTQRQDSRRTT
jgi:excisionase family DNA binding protein